MEAKTQKIMEKEKQNTFIKTAQKREQYLTNKQKENTHHEKISMGAGVSL